MKQAWSVTVVVVGACLLSARVAAEEAKPKPAASTSVQATVAPPASSAKKGPSVAEAVGKLNGTWDIELTPMYGEKPKQPIKDTLQFEQSRVSSQKLTTDGFSPTNATVTVGDDGIPVWETMQSSDAKGVVFWRGELHGGSMQGILSKHPVNGNAEDYAFSGKQTGSQASVQIPPIVQPPIPVTPTAPAPAAPTPTPTPTSTAPATETKAPQAPVAPAVVAPAPVTPPAAPPVVAPKPTPSARSDAKTAPEKPADTKAKKKKWF